MSLVAGAKVGPYEILEPLGAGGMGEVYLAQDTRLGRKVAVKVLPTQFAGDTERLARFEQEARAAAALNHPHIAAVFDVGAEGEGAARTHYMVQEYLQGETLREVTAGGKLALARALELGEEIVEALVAAHAAGIVHRDLKPENVFVTGDGHAKVLDFGLAKLTELSVLSSPGDGGQTRSPTMVGTVAGQIMGTAGYMAPEQVEGQELDARADLFAFGCVLYELVTGRRAFAGKSVHDTLHRIVDEEPTALGQIDAALPLRLQWLLEKCLAKSPVARYQSAGDLLVDLRKIDSEVGTGIAEPLRAAPVVEASGNAAPRGVPVALLGAVALVAAALAVGASWMLQPAAEPAPVRVFDFDYAEGQSALPCCGNQVAIARDGSFIVYAALEDGTQRLFVRRLDQYEATQIAGVEGGAPAISPDGKWIAYRSAGQSGRGVYKVALAGGAPFLLAEQGGVPHWADDGYVYIDTRGGSARVPENGGTVEHLPTAGLEEGMEIWRSFAIPGGSALLVDFERDAGEPGIGVLLLQSGQFTVLVDEGTDARYVDTGHVLYVRGGVLYALPFDVSSLRATGPAVPVLQGLQVDFTGSAQAAVAGDGTLVWQPGSAASGFATPRRLVALDETGAAIPLAGRVAAYGDAQVSPDGRRIAATVAPASRDADRDVWILDIDQGTLARLTVVGGNAPVWSPDGEWVYFSSSREGSAGGDIWRRRSDFSGGPELILTREGSQWPVSVTPDGARVLFDEWNGETANIGIAPIDGSGEAALLVVGGTFNERDAVISPDGRWVAYVADDSGTSQVYVREIDGQRRWLVSPDNAGRPAWAPDGRALYYAGFQPQRVWVADVAPGDTFSASAPRQLFDVEAGTRAPFQVLADGKLLALVDAGDGTDEDAVPAPTRLNFVLGWFQELRRLAPPER